MLIATDSVNAPALPPATVPAIGWCGSPGQAAAMHAAGLDHIELQLVPLRLEEDAALADACARVRELPLPAPVMSYLFPHDLRLVGPVVHEDRARAYLDRVLVLMQAAGARQLVYGSGWTRNIPDGFEAERAHAQFLHALRWCGEALAAVGATLVIEPLNRKESNLCNRVSEGVDWARRTGLPNVKGLADFYHVDEEAEPLDTLARVGGELAHVHLADTGRMNPGTGQYDYAGFFGHLKRAGYAGRFSGECGIHGDPVAGMRRSAEFLRAAWLA